MRTTRGWGHVSSAIAVIALVGIGAIAPAVAGKPGGGGGGATLDGGRIWFYDHSVQDRWMNIPGIVGSMSPDGSNVATLPGLSLWGDVSDGPHDGRRWILKMEQLPDGLYPVVYDTRDTGYLDPATQTWVPVHARYALTVAPVPPGTDAGVARFRADPGSGAPDARATWAQKDAPGVYRLHEVGIDWAGFTAGTPAPIGVDSHSLHDWSADGRTLVRAYNYGAGEHLHRTTWDATGVPTSVDLGPGYDPQVSATRRVAFLRGSGTQTSGIWTMSLDSTDGSDAAVLVPDEGVYEIDFHMGAWSPSGTWFAYTVHDSKAGINWASTYKLVLRHLASTTTRTYKAKTVLGWVE